MADGHSYRVSIHDRDLEPVGVPPHPHRLMQIWKAHEDGASGSACTHDQYTDGATAEEARRQRVLDAHLNSFLRGRIARASGAGRSGSSKGTISVFLSVHSKAPRIPPCGA